MMKIRKGDTVKIISGKYAGKAGKALTILPKEQKVVVEGINLFKKHRKPRRSGEKGQIVEMIRPVDVSKMMLVCPKCGQATRVGFKISDSEKNRVCKKCRQEIR